MTWSEGCRPWGCPLKCRRSASSRDREGYVSLLAMSFAFGLAVFGTAMAVGLRAYLVASTAEQRDLLDRITLESAANDLLGRLAAGEVHSIRPSRPAEFELNQRRLAIELSLPEGKRDLLGDPDRTVLEALQKRGMTAAREDRPDPSSFETVEAMSRGWRLSANEEDCLRRLVTVGRAPEAFRPEAASGDGEGLTRSITAGDQVDVRASLATQSGVKVLWVRARFTGAAERPWRVHDYRRLQVGSSPAPCTPVA